MTVQETIARLSSEKQLLQQFSVKALYLFGSIVRGDDRPGSDIDILVEFEPDARVGLFTFSRLQRRLSEILGRPVDLVTPDALHKALKDRILEEAVHAV
jgi:predicted nucleotidyltransferase